MYGAAKSTMNPTQDAKLTKLCDGLALAHSNNFGPFSNSSLSSFPPMVVIQWSQKIWKMKRGFHKKNQMWRNLLRIWKRGSADVACVDHPAQRIYLAAPLCGRFTACWQDNSSEAHRSAIEDDPKSNMKEKQKIGGQEWMWARNGPDSSEDGTVWPSGLPAAASSLAPLCLSQFFVCFFKFVLILLFDNIFG